MKTIKTERSLSTIAALLLFAVFAVGVLAVLFGGAKAYNRITERERQSYNLRTSSQYVMTKLRQAESPQAIKIVPFGEGEALQISQTVEGKEYATRIYCHNGWLMELFAAADGDFSAADGEPVLNISDLSVGLENGILKITLTDNVGESVSVRHALRSEAAE